MANYIKPVVFRLGKEMYGVDINLVQSIEKDLNVVPVPNSQTYIRGIVNMRSEVIPVYSLAKKFGKDSEATAESTIIINLGDIKLALEVDEVLEIHDIDEAHIVTMPHMLVKQDTQYLDRVANVDGKLIMLLDVEKLLSDEEEDSVKQITEELQS
jgi:purine-binding chemotaxis protein CheW